MTNPSKDRTDELAGRATAHSNKTPVDRATVKVVEAALALLESKRAAPMTALGQKQTFGRV
jgi:hypothetical protein